MEFYLTAILAADSFETLNNIMEDAAFDETITSSEYQYLCDKAIEKVRTTA